MRARYPCHARTLSPLTPTADPRKHWGESYPRRSARIFPDFPGKGIREEVGRSQASPARRLLTGDAAQRRAAWVAASRLRPHGAFPVVVPRRNADDRARRPQHPRPAAATTVADGDNRCGSGRSDERNRGRPPFTTGHLVGHGCQPPASDAFGNDRSGKAGRNAFPPGSDLGTQDPDREDALSRRIPTPRPPQDLPASRRVYGIPARPSS